MESSYLHIYFTFMFLKWFLVSIVNDTFILTIRLINELYSEVMKPL